MELLDKNAILNDLHLTICKVTFTKANGEERTMYCTLNETMIPKVEQTSETKRTKKSNPDVQAVYDVNVADWRSFRWDSIKEFKSEMNL